MQAGGHTTDLSVNAAQSSSTASASVWFPVLDNCVYKPIDLRVRQGVPRVITKTPERLGTDRPDDWVGIDDKFLYEDQRPWKVNWANANYL